MTNEMEKIAEYVINNAVKEGVRRKNNGETTLTILSHEVLIQAFNVFVDGLCDLVLTDDNVARVAKEIYKG